MLKNKIKFIFVEGLKKLLRLMDRTLFDIDSNIKIICTYIDGRKEVEEIHNIITNLGLNLLVQSGLKATGHPGGIKYVALGSDNTAVSVSDTTLGSEQFRKQVTSQVNGLTGVFVTSVYIDTDEATGFTIEEIGWFAGSATASADTGILYSHVLYSKAKTSLESIQIERTDTITEV